MNSYLRVLELIHFRGDNCNVSSFQRSAEEVAVKQEPCYNFWQCADNRCTTNISDLAELLCHLASRAGRSDKTYPGMWPNDLHLRSNGIEDTYAPFSRGMHKMPMHSLFTPSFCRELNSLHVKRQAIRDFQEGRGPAILHQNNSCVLTYLFNDR